jgi:glycosyltransferase involved in cell wall biosynthesis
MRIGVLATSYPREAGDPAGAFVAGQARDLAGRGHDVEVVAAGPGRSTDGEIRVHRVLAGSSLFYGEGAPDKLERSPFALAAAPLFTAALAAAAARRARGWDRIVAHWLLPSGLVAAPLRPTVAIAHSGDVHLAIRLGIAGVVAATLVATGSRVVFVADHLRLRFLAAVPRPLRGRLAARSSVCPMGIEPPPPRDRAAARRRFGLDASDGPRRPVVAFLGRLVPLKGVATLLAALPEGAELLIGGDGPLRDRLRALASPRVRFLGELRGDDRADLFAAADVFVLPSVAIGDRTEGAPTVLGEAMAAGVPVVASDVPGARSMCGDAALYARPGDAGALSRALAAALYGNGTAGRVDRGRERAVALSWSAVGRQLSDVIDDLRQETTSPAAHEAKRIQASVSASRLRPT